MINVCHDRGYMADLVSATPSISHLALLDKDNLNSNAVLTFIRDYDMDPTYATGMLWPQLHAITTTSTNFQLLREVVLGRIGAGCPLRKLSLLLQTSAYEVTWFSNHLEVEILDPEDMLDAVISIVTFPVL
jgi:hypothetical protein